MHLEWTLFPVSDCCAPKSRILDAFSGFVRLS